MFEIILIFSRGRQPLAIFSYRLEAQRRLFLVTTFRLFELDMALGILEPRAENVPGTVQVTRQSNNELSKSRTTILVPKPTDDPNDPLVSPLKST